jgi:hypothetical protein
MYLPADKEKREIATCVREYYQKRLELVKEFSSFKDSLRFEGEVQKKEIYFVEMGEFGTFFKNYHHSIVDLIEKIILDPKIIAKLISLFPDAKKIKFEDFFQNIVFNVYPCYLPSSKQGSPLMEFMRAVLSHWPYNHELMRPTQYSLLDQAISGFMKAPEIVCYVEKIVSRFLQDASNCHMSTFAFDEEAYPVSNSESKMKCRSRSRQMLPFLSTTNPRSHSRTSSKISLRGIRMIRNSRVQWSRPAIPASTTRIASSATSQIAVTSRVFPSWT